MFTPSEIAKKIKQCAKEHGITVKYLLQQAGVGEKLVSNMSGKNGSYPQSDKLVKIADYLNVSVDYLLGISDDPSRAGKSLNNLSANELTIIELFSSLSDTQQGELIGRAKMMAEQNESVFRQEGAV